MGAVAELWPHRLDDRQEDVEPRLWREKSASKAASATHVEANAAAAGAGPEDIAAELKARKQAAQKKTITVKAS